MKPKPEFKTAEMWEAYVAARKEFNEARHQDQLMVPGLVGRQNRDRLSLAVERKLSAQQNWNKTV